jgi:hypothetical protein
MLQFTDYMKLNKKEDQVSTFQSFLEEVTKHPWEEILILSVEGRLKERPARDCPTCDISHIQPPSPDTIVDAKKCMLTEA